MIIRISRETGERYDDFLVDCSNELTVLDLLFQLQAKYDQTLAFRYSCRGAICGSCAILVNGVPVLACRTILEKILSNDIPGDVLIPTGAAVPEKGLILEPLPKLPVIRDLIVDWEPFFDFYQNIEPVLKLVDIPPRNEHLMDKNEVTKLEKYTNCILCLLCFSACPIVGETTDYPGPAALAKLYRFYLDPREPDSEKRLKLADKDSGWWACDFYKNCNKVCPKGVPPNIAIGKARGALKKKGDR